LAAAGWASAAHNGTTMQGRPFVSGGISAEELATLHADRERYSLWVITAARKTGAHLADVEIKVWDAKKSLVLLERMEGPWLFVDLPLGGYTIEAALRGTVQRHVTTIHRGDHHQAMFYFDVDAEVSPEPQSPFVDSPYGDDKGKAPTKQP
jgi:hypothetical protein